MVGSDQGLPPRLGDRALVGAVLDQARDAGGPEAYGRITVALQGEM